MIVQQDLADVSPAVVCEPSETALSWQGRSCDELRAIAGRGAHGGEMYFAAVKELERRAHDSEVALEERRTTAIARGNEITWSLAVLVAAVVAAGIALLLGY